MAKINGLLEMGRRGLSLSQSAIQTTSHNINSKDVEGFSRQRAEIQTNPAMGAGPTRVGTGAKLAGITRAHDPILERQLEKEGAAFSRLDQKAQGLNRLESALNEQSVKGLSDSIGNFFNSFREMANNPESSITRTQVRESAIALVNQFQRAQSQIKDVSTHMNKNIEYSVVEVNSMAKEIADLNERIQRVEIDGAKSANDERDHRDALLKKMAEKIDISYSEDARTGIVNVTAGRSVNIVVGGSYSQLRTKENENGQMTIIHELSPGGTQIDISDQFAKGKIGAALEVRDVHTAGLVKNLNDLAQNIATEVNRAHSEGYDRYNNKGADFFNLNLQNGQFAIENLSVSRDIVNDVSRIAVAAQPNAPGDNTVANVIQNLQMRPLMGNGKYTYDDFYNSKISELGVLNQRANTELATQENAVIQLKNIRESISGVNMDEEATNLMEFQKSFEASARLVRTADEMFDTVLNLKRM